MKREFLKGLGIEGLTDEVIEKIMAENGKDIESTKTKADKSQEIENLKSQIESKDKLIEESNAQIQKFKEMDVDSIQKSAGEWEQKYKDFEIQSKAEKEAYEKKLTDQAYNFAVKDFVSQHKFTSDFAKNAFIEDFKKQELKLNEGKFLGADDYIKQFQEKNQGIFAIEEPEKETQQLPSWTVPGAGSQSQQGTDNGMHFNFMPIHDRPKNQ